MTAVLSLSNSEIQSYKWCRRNWYLSYYLQWGYPQDKPETGARTTGTRVHIALQSWYEGVDLDPIEHVCRLYDEDIARWPNAATELMKEKDLVRAMIEGYVQWVQETGVDTFLEYYAMEQTVECESPVPGVKIRGRLDARAIRKTDNVRLFIDHKTKPSVEGLGRFLSRDEQVKFYMLLEYLDALEKSGSEQPERTEGAIYNLLKRVKRTGTAKPPFYGRLEIRHNKATMESMWLRVKKEIEEIVQLRADLDAGGDHRYFAYPTPNGECEWKCPFAGLCPMLDDGSNWTGMLEANYVRTDPYERYKNDMEKKE